MSRNAEISMKLEKAKEEEFERLRLMDEAQRLLDEKRAIAAKEE